MGRESEILINKWQSKPKRNPNVFVSWNGDVMLYAMIHFQH